MNKRLSGNNCGSLEAGQASSGLAEPLTSMTHRSNPIVPIVIACLMAIGAFCGMRTEALPWTQVLCNNRDAEFLELSTDLTNRAWFSKIADQAYRPEALIQDADRDPLDVVLRRTGALLDDAKGASPKLSLLEQQISSLKSAAGNVGVTDQTAHRALFNQACDLRREIAFSNPALNFQSLLFTLSKSSGGDYHMCDQYYGGYARPGGSLYILNKPFGKNPSLINPLANSIVGQGRLKGQKLQSGMFLNASLSYDGQWIVFAYSECGLNTTNPAPRPYGQAIWSPEHSFHIFKVKTDGTGLAQLTDGPWNDLHPCWLPDGRIVFISERRGGFLRCSGDRPCPGYTLHAMDADGGRMVRLSYHETNEWLPSVNNDGMIVYTRWDYVDRGADTAHHPWITTPDGRDPRAIQGNYKKQHHSAPDMELYMRAIPGSHRYMALAAPHHGAAYGSLIVIDPRVPDDDAMASVKRFTPEEGFPEMVMTREYQGRDCPDRLGGDGFGWSGPAETSRQRYGAAWPLSEKVCVTTRDQGLYLVDAFGNRELLFRTNDWYCLGPVPLQSRPTPPIIPPVGEPPLLVNHPSWTRIGDEHPLDAKSVGMTAKAIVGVANVYDSRYPLPEGTKIKSMRIIQVLPKTTVLHQDPWIGYGRETGARAVLGTVPVEADGSVQFYLPPGKSVYFQVLDDKGRAVQSMKSATYAHGGETLLCAGCHESKNQALPRKTTATPLAFRRQPSVIAPEPDGSNPFSFARLVQPVLNRQCIGCHDGTKDTGHSFELRPGGWDQDRYKWFASYRNLHPYAWHSGADGEGFDLWEQTRSIPGKVGARASKLLPLLENKHQGVTLSDDDHRRLVVWLDANSDFFGAYENIEAQARGEVVQPRLQ